MMKTRQSLFYLFIALLAALYVPVGHAAEENSGSGSPEPQTQKYISCILLSDDAKTLWIGKTGLLEEWDYETGGLKKTYRTLGDLPLVVDNVHKLMIDLLSDDNNGLWAVTPQGAVHLHADGTHETFLHPNVTWMPDQFSTAVRDHKGGLFLGSWAAGPSHIHADGSSELITGTHPDMPADTPYIVSDAAGGIWAASQKGGIAHLKEDGSLQLFTPENSPLRGRMERSLKDDGSGGFWAHSKDKDEKYFVHTFADGNIELFSAKTLGSPHARFHVIEPDHSGGIFIISGSHADPGIQFYSLRHMAADGTLNIIYDTWSSSSQPIRLDCFRGDGKGNLWLSTNEGLYRIKQDQSWEVFTHENSNLAEDTRYSLYPDGKGGIWINSSKGLSRFESGVVSNIIHY